MAPYGLGEEMAMFDPDTSTLPPRSANGENEEGASRFARLRMRLLIHNTLNALLLSLSFAQLSGDHTI